MKEVDLPSLLRKEKRRQNNGLELIASENFVSREVLKYQGSLLTNKYAEGYPAVRYYGGCEYVDQIESLAIERAKQLFKCDHANVQPHSGSQANAAVYLSILKPGDKVLAMNLSAGGHLTHGHQLSFSGQIYQFHSYGVDPETNRIDYKEVRRLALEIKPRLIVCGASSYSRIIDFAAFRQIADEVGAYLMVDMAHIAGLVAAGLHPSPVPYAHFVTSTTHKTLRGPRGGLILCKAELAKSLDRAVFPGTQGGPLIHIIAAKAQAFGEALTADFITYQQKVVANAAAMADRFSAHHIPVISGGTDNHMLVIDTYQGLGITGGEAENLLSKIHITVNKNAVPFDTLPPRNPSGIRLGTPALTTRGLTVAQAEKIADIIVDCLKNHQNAKRLKELKKEVAAISKSLLDVTKISYKL